MSVDVTVWLIKYCFIILNKNVSATVAAIKMFVKLLMSEKYVATDSY